MSIVHRIKQVVLCSLLLTVIACDDFTDMNKEKTKAIDVPISGVLTGAQVSNMHELHRFTHDITNKLVMYTTRYEDEYADKFDIEAKEPMWGLTYVAHRNLDKLLNSGEGYENYRGVALVIKSYLYYNLTNLYGDIPYTEAAQAENKINSPKYDTQEIIYEGLVADLEEANELIGSGTIALSGDIFYDGDLALWKKFANSFMVKVLMSRSKKIDPSARLKAMMADPETYPVFETYTEQPVFKFLTDEDNCYRRTKHEGWLSTTAMTNTFIDFLKTTGDERIKTMADYVAESGEFVGTQHASLEGFDVTEVSMQSVLFMEAKENPIIELPWMRCSELQFLLAEAAEKGYIDGGTDKAEEYYKKAIRSSYDYQKWMGDQALALGLRIKAMKEFSEGFYMNPIVAYTGTRDEKLEKIGQQTWVALFNDIESYFSKRRTGYPELTPGPATLNNHVMPVRFTYPNSEKLSNTDNYNAAIAVQGADEINTKMWIIK